MDLHSLLTLAGIGGVAFVGSRVLVGGSNKREGLKRAANRLSQFAAANNLPILNSTLEAVAIGDLSGTISGIRQIADILGDPEASKSVLENFLKGQLKKQVATVEGREALARFIATEFKIQIDFEALRGVRIEQAVVAATPPPPIVQPVQVV